MQEKLLYTLYTKLFPIVYKSFVSSPDSLVGCISLASLASLSSTLCSPAHYHLFSHLTDASSTQYSYTASLTTFTPFCSIFISTLLSLPNTSLHLSLTFSFSFVYFVFFSFFLHMCLSFAFYCDRDFI